MATINSDTYKTWLLRFGYTGLGIVFIAIALAIYDSNGYTNSLIVGFETLTIAIGLYYIVHAVSVTAQTGIGVRRFAPNFIPVIFLIITIFVWGEATQPVFGTDEIALAYAGALALVRGFNPYTPSIITTIFNHLPFNDVLITPLRTGGIITLTPYPALSFLVFLPSVIFRFPPAHTLLAFALAFPLFLYWVYLKRGLDFMMPLVLFLLLANFDYVSYADGGLLDIIWVVLLSMSIYFMLERKDIYSGIFLGLAVSVKLLPAFIVPFMLWFAYKEHNKIGKILLSAIGAFLLINGYFMILSPINFVNSVLSPETLPLIGIGTGLSQWAFSGAFFLPPWIFPLYLGVLFIITLVLYMKYYDSFKWGFFIFPAIILLLNYRLLGNYLVYWPLFLFLLFPYMMEEQQGGKEGDEMIKEDDVL